MSSMSEYSSDDLDFDFPLTPSSSVPFDWPQQPQKPAEDALKLTLDGMLADLDCRPLIVRSAFTDDSLFGLGSHFDSFERPSTVSMASIMRDSALPADAHAAFGDQIDASFVDGRGTGQGYIDPCVAGSQGFIDSCVTSPQAYINPSATNSDSFMDPVVKNSFIDPSETNSALNSFVDLSATTLHTFVDPSVTTSDASTSHFADPSTPNLHFIDPASTNSHFIDPSAPNSPSFIDPIAHSLDTQNSFLHAQLAEIRRRTSDETLAQHAARTGKNTARLNNSATLKRKKAQLFSAADRQISTASPASSVPPLTPASSSGSFEYPNRLQIASPHRSHQQQQSPVTPVSMYTPNVFIRHGSPTMSMSPAQLSSPPAPPHYVPSSNIPPTPSSPHGYFFHTSSFQQQPMMQTPPHLQHHIPHPALQQRNIKPLPSKRPKSPAGPRSKSSLPTTPTQLSFVNYTSDDAQRLSSAVAPSGNGKRKAAQLLQGPPISLMQFSNSSPSKKVKKS